MLARRAAPSQAKSVDPLEPVLALGFLLTMLLRAVHGSTTVLGTLGFCITLQV